VSNGTKSSSMRSQMPFTTSVIDELRKHFQADQIDPSIRAGMAGEPKFWASENGHEVGTRVELGPDSMTWDAEALQRHAEDVQADRQARERQARRDGR
jgi:hypothetical protein